MNTDKISLREYLKSIQIVYFALLLGQIIFAVIAFFLAFNKEMGYENIDFSGVFKIIVPLLVITSIALSHFVFQKRLSALKSNAHLSNKLTDYRSALIVRWALLEGPSFLSIIVFLLTGDYLILGMVVFIIGFFLYVFPSKQRIEGDLDLNWEDKSQLGD